MRTKWEHELLESTRLDEAKSYDTSGIVKQIESALLNYGKVKKQVEKEVHKTAKEIVKTLKKEGWEVTLRSVTGVDVDEMVDPLKISLKVGDNFVDIHQYDIEWRYPGDGTEVASISPRSKASIWIGTNPLFVPNNVKAIVDALKG